MVSNDFSRFFGEAVRKHRKAKSFTQEELAERADLAPKMISLIERFQRNPSMNVAHSIAHALGVPLWRVVKDAEDMRKVASKRAK
jgi:transcriptional regulator with XRE-family HTH domain